LDKAITATAKLLRGNKYTNVSAVLGGSNFNPIINTHRHVVRMHHVLLCAPNGKLTNLAALYNIVLRPLPHEQRPISVRLPRTEKERKSCFERILDGLADNTLRKQKNDLD